MEMAELMHRVRVDFAAELRALAKQHEADALPTSQERCFAPLEVSTRSLLDDTTASATATLASSSSSVPSLRVFLRLIFRRYAGKLIVQGRLLNHEELLVSRFLRLSADGEASDDFCVEIQPDAVRFVVDCEQAKTAQVGRDDVVARLQDAPRVVSDHIDDDESVHTSTLPAVSCGGCEQYEGAKYWSNTRALEQLDELYGFNLHAAVAIATTTEGVNAMLRCHRSAADIGSTRVMMHAFGIPVTGGSQSFAVPRLAAVIRHGGDAFFNDKCSKASADAWSYQALDAAQKRKWARERFELADELMAKGRVKDAILEFANCLKLDENHLKALAAKGRAHARLQQLPEAVEAFEAVLGQNRAFPGVKQELLRVRGKLEHSRHVLGGESLVSRAVETAVRHETTAASSGGMAERAAGIREAGDGARSHSAASMDKALERSRLRRLLEDEERRKRHKRRKKRARDSSSDDASDDSRTSRKQRSKRSSSSSKKARNKKPRKSHKKSSGAKKHRKHSKSKTRRRHRRGRDSDASSSDCSSSEDDSSHYSSSSQAKCKEARRKGERDSRQEELPAILARPQHRIWN